MIYGIAITVIALAIGGAGIGGYVKGQKKVQAKWDLSVLQAKDAANELERMNRMSKEKALEDLTKNITAKAVAADRARVTADGLRIESQRSLAAAETDHASCLKSASAHAELLGRCERRYRDVAAIAQGHVSDVIACNASWPK